MNDISWLIAANALVWCGLGLYLFLLQRRCAVLINRIAVLERGQHHKDAS